MECIPEAGINHVVTHARLCRHSVYSKVMLSGKVRFDTVMKCYAAFERFGNEGMR